ncbi:MAG: sugar transferase [Lachnospiraceae bacterium]|nr:sugar transferase [Lachnospiraceae bacterium]
MYRFRNNVQNLIVIFIDCICIALSMHLANYIRHKEWMSQEYVVNITGIFLISYILVYLVVNFNRRISENGYLAELVTCAKISVSDAFLAILLIYFTRRVDADFSRGLVGYFLVINTMLLYMCHLILRTSFNNFYDHGASARQLFLVCDYDNVAELVDSLLQKNRWDYKVRNIAIVDSDHRKEKILDIPIIAYTKEEILEYCKSNIVDEMLIVTANGSVSSIINEVISMGITVHVGLKTFNLNLDSKSTVTLIGDQSAITFYNRFLTMKEALLKRLLDLVGGLVGSLVALLLTIVLGPMIKLESPGPIFFKQKRVGKNGRYFMMYKFRSMYADAEERKKALMAQNQMEGLMFKMDNDPRITKIGKFLRNTSLDEFPQFFNVLKGDMSLVGTRPPTVDEFLQYSSYHKMRLSIKPGITGLWQISGRSDITDFEEVVRLDVKYINEWNFWLDIKILLKTVGVVFKREGAK